MDTDQRAAHLRTLLSRAVEQTSLRSVARSAGLSPTGLKKFLNGAAPYSPTWRKLKAWEEREQVGGREREVAAALDVLLIRVPAEKRAEVERTIRELVAMLEQEPPRPRPPTLVGVDPTFFCPHCNRDFPVLDEAVHQKMHREEDLAVSHQQPMELHVTERQGPRWRAAD